MGLASIYRSIKRPWKRNSPRQPEFGYSVMQGSPSSQSNTTCAWSSSKQEISELLPCSAPARALKFSYGNPWLRSLKATQVCPNSQSTFWTLPYHGNGCFHLVVDADLQILTPKCSVNSLTAGPGFVLWPVIKSLTLVLIPFSFFLELQEHLQFFHDRKAHSEYCSRQLLCVRV